MRLQQKTKEMIGMPNRNGFLLALKVQAALGAILLMLFFMSGMGRRLVHRESGRKEVVEAPAVSAAAPLNLRPGQRFAVVLDGNPTTGYIWQLADKLPADSCVQVSLTTPVDCEEDCCGFPMPTTLAIIAVKPGAQRVHVVYARPWEKGKSPAEELVYDVVVSSAQD